MNHDFDDSSLRADDDSSRHDDFPGHDDLDDPPGRPYRVAERPSIATHSFARLPLRQPWPPASWIPPDDVTDRRELERLYHEWHDARREAQMRATMAAIDDRDRHRLLIRIDHPGTFGLAGAQRWSAIAVRDEWLRDLATLDDEIQDRIVRRRELIERITKANVVINGTGNCYDTKRRTLVRLIWNTKIPFEDPPHTWVTTSEPRRTLRGRALHAAAVDLLRASGDALSLDEMHRLLLAHGFDVEPPVSRNLSNALRTDVKQGRVQRYERGLYGYARDTAA